MTHDITLLAPTFVEYLALRLVRPPARVVWAGMRLARIDITYLDASGEPFIVCGLAGALVPSLAPGAVVIPEVIGLVDGSRVACDPELVARLIAGAHALGYSVETGPLLTASAIVTGNERATWAERGYLAADMETGLLVHANCRFATVRVILDTPARPIAADWQRPVQALRQPRLWRELAWLGFDGPRYALRAARVAKTGLSML